jgi:hypothetical protein
MGLTEGVRSVFKANPTWFSTKEMRSHVEALGVGLGDLKNPDASVISVLNRLTASGELEASSRKEKTAGGIVTVKLWRPKYTSDEPMEPITDDDIPF